MTLRSSLHEFLRDAIDVSVHEARLPLRPMMPALVNRFITGSTVQTHSKRRSLVERRIQVDAYADNWAETDALATAVLLALDGFHGVMGDVAIGWMHMIVDSEAQPAEIKGGQVRYRRSLDFALGYQEGLAVGS